MKYIAKLLLVSMLLTSAAQAAPRPNIILIMVDDMGWSDIGCYGSEIDTPNLDSLAANGVRFQDFYNTSKCFPTRACLLTGVYAHQSGFDDSSSNVLKNSVTLGETLRLAGYHTYASGKNHGEDNLYDRGFDHYYGLRDGACNHFNPTNTARPGEPAPANKGSERYWADDGLVFSTWNTAYQDYFPPLASVDPPAFYSTDAFTAKAIEYLEEWDDTGKSDPFFLYIAYTAPHDPLMAWPSDIAKYEDVYDVGYETIRNARYQKQLDLGLVNASQHALSPPTHQNWNSLSQSAKADQARRMQVYAAMIDRVDQKIGEVITKLQQMGVYDDTLILFCSDNGASAENVSAGDTTAEIGGLERYASLQSHWANVSNTPFQYYKNNSEEGGIRTPLIAHWPNGIANPGRFTEKAGHVIDFMATFVELTGADYPRFYEGTGVTPMQGESFTDVLYDQTITPHSTLYFEWSSGRAVRDGDYKLVSRDSGGTWKLYDMSIDATELNDLSSSHGTIRDNLLDKFNTWWLAVNNNNLPTAYDVSAGTVFPDPVSINLSASDGDGSVNWSTLAIAGQPTHGTVSITGSNTVLYTPTSDAPSDTFTYQVKDNDGEISNEGLVAVTMIDSTTPPSAPSGLTATARDGSAWLDWDDNVDFDLAGYKIKRAMVSGGPYTEIGTASAGDSDYIDLNCVNGRDYYYVVTAFDDLDNESTESSEATATPYIITSYIYAGENYTDSFECEITNNHSGFNGSGYVNMGGNGSWFEWNKVDGGGSGGSFTLTFRYANGDGEDDDRPCEISVDGVPAGTLVFPGVPGDWTFWSTQTINDVTLSSGFNTIRVMANTDEGGPNIDEMEVLHSSAPATAPAALTAGPGNGVLLDWAAESDVWFYSVYRSETSGESYQYLADTQDNFYNDPTAAYGTPYYYVVTTVNTDHNESSYSSEVPIIVYDGDLTADGKVNMEDLAELGMDWLNGYNMDTLLNVADDWLLNQGP